MDFNLCFRIFRKLVLSTPVVRATLNSETYFSQHPREIFSFATLPLVVVTNSFREIAGEIVSVDLLYRHNDANTMIWKLQEFGP